MIRGAALCFACALLLVPPAAGAPPRAVEPGAFSWAHLNPPELQFSCVGQSDEAEERYAKQLAAAESAPEARLSAAEALWTGRSRRYAADVLKFVAGAPPGGAAFRAFQRTVEAGVRPDAIRRELRDGDYLWGTWLAFLRPHADAVPDLLAGLKDKPKLLSETVLALGSSGDPRALKPLLELLASKEYQPAGDAAQALGYFGDASTEPKLIAALAEGNVWRQVNACGALARMGTREALPALEKLAKDDRDTGALDVKGMAEYAVETIKKRDKR